MGDEFGISKLTELLSYISFWVGKMGSMSILQLSVLVLTLHLIFGDCIQNKTTLTFSVLSIERPDSSVQTIIHVKTAGLCGMECLNRHEDCEAFTYNVTEDGKCYLYQHISLDEVGAEVFAVSRPQPQTIKTQLGLLASF